MGNSDLDLDRFSDALSGLTIDVVVSGSIGAGEAVRFIRALRRVGATVVPHLTSGGAQFTTSMALSWAAGRECVTAFQGAASHISCHDALVVAPASANFISMVAHGLMSTPSTALAASYLGMRKPVMMLPAAHDSLLAAPAMVANLERVSEWVSLIHPRVEEGKKKFPDPATLADEVAHRINRARWGTNGVLVTMGGTRAWIDDVRYLGNYSSGRLGSLIAEELYRFGFETLVVHGACEHKPRRATAMVSALTNDDMERAVKEALRGPMGERFEGPVSPAAAAVLSAAVLDFAPTVKREGKVSSSVETLSVEFRPTRKIIAEVHPSGGVKVGFKLEAALDESRVRELAARHMPEYGLSLMVLNALADVDSDRHRAWFVERRGDGVLTAPRMIAGKREVARAIASHVHESLKRRER